MIFNHTTGRYVTVSNYPGTTVEIAHGMMVIKGKRFPIIDTPGVNSLIPMSEYEKVTRDILLKERNKFVIQVIYSKNLRITIEELGLGDEGRIVFISSNSHHRLDRLNTLGIVPGSIIKMHQKNPPFVIQIGETTLALDKDIVKDIYVKRI